MNSDHGRLSKTTTVGLIAGDYVVLAADKRATAGAGVYHKRVKKIHRVDDYIAMTISGLVADAQFLIEQARYISGRYKREVGKNIMVSSLANYVGLILQAYLRISPYVVQLLIGGYDQKGPQLYYLDLYGSLTSEKYMATGSGSPVAFGVLEEGYRENMNLDEAIELAYKAVSTAIKRDGFTGEGVDIVIIGPDTYREETRLFRQDLVVK